MPAIINKDAYALRQERLEYIASCGRKQSVGERYDTIFIDLWDMIVLREQAKNDSEYIDLRNDEVESYSDGKTLNLVKHLLDASAEINLSIPTEYKDNNDVLQRLEAITLKTTKEISFYSLLHRMVDSPQVIKIAHSPQPFHNVVDYAVTYPVFDKDMFTAVMESLDKQSVELDLRLMCNLLCVASGRKSFDALLANFEARPAFWAFNEDVRKFQAIFSAQCKKGNTAVLSGLMAYRERCDSLLAIPLASLADYAKSFGGRQATWADKIIKKLGALELGEAELSAPIEAISPKF